MIGHRRKRGIPATTISHIGVIHIQGVQLDDNVVRGLSVVQGASVQYIIQQPAIVHQYFTGRIQQPGDDNLVAH